MNERKVVRPQLDADDIKTLMDGLERLIEDAKTMDEMDPLWALSARLAKAGMTVGYYREG